jgi:hypothetical protein
MEILDELDAYFPNPSEPASRTSGNPPTFPARAGRLRARLEAANSAVYRSIRSEIRNGGGPDFLLPWIDLCRSRDASRPALSYDHLDELISGVLELREPVGEQAAPGPEVVFYQPTPMRHILRLLAVCKLSPSDVFIDLGSGLGHVAIVASILSSVQGVGIESEAAYVRSARACARSLKLRRVSFIRQDARDADLSAGTVFYLYTPFTGSILASVLRKLRQESARRPIRICSLGPCSLVLGRQPWLKARAHPTADRIACFRSRDSA